MTSEELPGLLARGRTVAETIEIAQDVARKLIETYIEDGEELPAALRGATQPSVDLRIPIGVE